MRHLLSILLLAFVVTSCKTDKPNGLLDPNAQLSINIVSGTAPRAESDEEQPLSPLEVVKQAMELHVTFSDNGMSGGRRILDKQRDLEKVAIKMFGNDIISESPRTKGQLQTDFIAGSNVYFTTLDSKDTIAYIPNRVLREAYIKVLAAYEAGDYPEVYKLFQEAYKAIPCTGKQYRELKTKNQH